MKNSLRLLPILLLLLSSCQHQEKTDNQEVSRKEITNAMLNANRDFVTEEEQQIIDLLKRYKWNMTRTETGLRYMVFQKGTGTKVHLGDDIQLKYSCKLITGDEIYNSDSDGLMQFKVGKGGAVSGIHEAILFMNRGDKAKIIVPSHLGYGLIGDNNRVPIRSTLIYEIEILDLSNK